MGFRSLTKKIIEKRHNAMPKACLNPETDNSKSGEKRKVSSAT